MMMLKITTGKEKGRTLELTADTPLTIGRSESSGFCIPDKKVSRRHAEIVSDGENVFITDLSSRTGTRVNGRAIAQRTPLCIGDTIQIGETDLVLEKTEDAQAAPARRLRQKRNRRSERRKRRLNGIFRSTPLRNRSPNSTAAPC